MSPTDYIKQVLYGFLSAGLVEHDAEKAISYFSDDVIGIGMGEQGFINTKAEAAACIAFKTELDVSYALEYASVAIRLQSTTIASVCAKVLIHRTADGQKSTSGLMQSLTLRDEGEIWRIIALHASPTLLNTESIDAYPLQFAETTLAHLRAELQTQAHELAISEERFRIALQKSTNIIFDYNLADGNIIRPRVAQKTEDFVTSLAKASSTLIIDGTIALDSMQDFLRVFEEIQGGASQAICEVKVLTAENRELWNKISMTAIKDATGRTLRAIGMIEDITPRKQAEFAYAREEQYRQTILSHALAYYVINFSKDICESSQIMSEHCVDIAPGTPYNQLIFEATQSRLSEQDRRAFLEVFAATSVLSAFERGCPELRLEYELIKLDGTTIWMQTILRVVLDPITNDRKGFLYVIDIDARKRNALMMERKAQIDTLTGAYNRDVSEEKIRALLKTSEGIRSGNFMMIDVDLFKNINDTYGHPFGDKVLASAAASIRSHFREGDIVGRLGGDEFCVFFCGIRSRLRIEQDARKICNSFHQLYTPAEGCATPSCSIGIALCRDEVKTFEQMYEEADKALYAAKAEGRDGYCIFNSE